MICRWRRLVVYPDRPGAGTSPRPSEGSKHRPAARPLEPHAGGLVHREQRRRDRRAGALIGCGLRRRASRDHGGDGLSGRPGRRGSTSGAGSRASGHASGCLAGTCASSRSLLRFWRVARITETRAPNTSPADARLETLRRGLSYVDAPDQASRRTACTVPVQPEKIQAGLQHRPLPGPRLEQAVPGFLSSFCNRLATNSMTLSRQKAAEAP